MKSRALKFSSLATVAILACVVGPHLAGAQSVSIYAKGDAGFPVPLGAAGDRLKTSSSVLPNGTEAPANLDNFGNLVTSSPMCAAAVQSVVVVGVTAVAAPTTPLSGRKVVRVCVSLENVGSPKVKCAIDSHPVMGFAVTDGGSPVGDVLQPGDCFAYPVDTTHSLKCVSDTAGTGVVTYEC